MGASSWRSLRGPIVERVLAEEGFVPRPNETIPLVAVKDDGLVEITKLLDPTVSNVPRERIYLSGPKECRALARMLNLIADDMEYESPLGPEQ